MATWNHRVVKSVEAGDDLFAIHEVHYNDEGEIFGVTENPVVATGGNIEELRETLQRMLRALDTPVLEDGKIEFKSPG